MRVLLLGPNGQLGHDIRCSHAPFRKVREDLFFREPERPEVELC